jgi:glycogen phosphorylase
MNGQVSADQRKYGLLPTNVKGVDALIELALDLRSSWNHGADNVWQQLDPELWQATQNPWVVLQTVSRDRLEYLLADAAFRKNVEELVRARRDTAHAPAWFQQTYPQSPLSSVAYFSMEFMLSEALPIYSGGLGNVAGDQLKAANDLGVPVIGVGLLYQQGYFRQLIGPDGAQQAAYPYNDPGQLPITPLRHASGEWLRLKVELPGHPIWVRAWQARVGRLKLYLLDTNDAANYPPYRGVTSELYGGGPELRLMQEMVLGMGGWRLLTALGIEPEVCHLNEGHAALVVLERARSFMDKTGEPFDVALTATRPGNLFTTHTAVPAGFDRFAASQIEHCLGTYAEKQLGITRHELLALGRQNPEDVSENFNMAYLAVRGSGAVNGVSRLHGHVSRKLFAPLFPRRPAHEVPIQHVTNGVHTPTWDSAPADALWTEACGQRRWLGTTASLGRDICCVSDADLWEFRSAASAALVDYVRERLSRQLAASGAKPDAAEGGGRRPLDPKTLTIGFARRFATYKRPDLLLHDPARLARLLCNPERPIQLVIAGKAHPADAAGQALIRQWIEFTQTPEVSDRVVFLSDYDMHLAEHLVQGVDVWLNTPRRPWEASGTSGMKVLVNGGINLSELDGWWAEAYTPEVGWALGDGEEHGDDAAWDAAEAETLYNLLEHEVVAEFYSRDEQGIPLAWVSRMRNSMAQLTAQFSTNRTVREYTERYYLPAATAYRARAARSGEFGARIAHWRRALDQKWATLRFGDLRTDTVDEQYVFEAEVYLGELGPDDVRIELYADGIGKDGPLCQPMRRVEQAAGTDGRYVFTGSVPAVRPLADFTARLLPRHAGASVPLEAPHILWQR